MKLYFYNGKVEERDGLIGVFRKEPLKTRAYMFAPNEFNDGWFYMEPKEAWIWKICPIKDVPPEFQMRALMET